MFIRNQRLAAVGGQAEGESTHGIGLMLYARTEHPSEHRACSVTVGLDLLYIVPKKYRNTNNQSGYLTSPQVHPASHQSYS